MVANTKDRLKDRLRQAMQERKISFPKLSTSTGIPKERMYKWYSENTNPKAEDAEILEKWISGDLEKVPRTTVSEGNTKGENQPSNATLEQTILNLSESDKIKARAIEASARNIERLITLLEMKMGVGPKYMELPEPGEKGTVRIGKGKVEEKNSGPSKDRNK